MELESTYACGFPVEIIERQLVSSWIYRLPGIKEMCYRFNLHKVHQTHTSICCTGCVTVYKKKKQQKTPIRHPKMRKLLGCSMEGDPSLGHHEECQMILYEEILRNYRQLVEETDTTKEVFDFPVMKFTKFDTNAMVHKFKEDHTKCLQFRYARLCHSGAVLVFCSACSAIHYKAKKKPHYYNLREDGFLEDPRLHHHHDCVPLSYTEIGNEHTIFGNRRTKETIRSWCSKMEESLAVPENQIEEIEKFDKSNDCQDAYCFAPGLGVIEAKLPNCYVYRIPNSDKCIRFGAQHFSKKTITMRCNRCSGIAKKVKGGNFSRIARTTDGFSMEEDPEHNHVPGCEPELYSEAMKNLVLIDKEHKADAEYAFPLLRMRKQLDLQLIYRFESDPTKCYVFTNRCMSKNAMRLVICNTCASIDRKLIRHSKSSRKSVKEIDRLACRPRVSLNGFMDDPFIGHHPECKPLCYKTTMTKKIYVDKTTTENFIQGALLKRKPLLERMNNALNVEGDQLAKTEFEATVIQKKNAISFVFQVPHRPRKAYVFYQMVHGDNSKLYCSTCLLADNITPANDIMIRKSDGFSMEQDPTKHHLDHCRAVHYNIIYGRQSRKEEGKLNANRQYGFPLEKHLRREQYQVIHRLKHDDTMCRKFVSVHYGVSTGHLLVKCGECANIISREKPKGLNIDHKFKLHHYRCTKSGFLDDPSLRHVPGCDPRLIEDVMRTYVLTGEEESDDFFMYRYTETQSHGIHLDRPALSQTIVPIGPKKVKHVQNPGIIILKKTNIKVESDVIDQDDIQSADGRSSCIDDAESPDANDDLVKSEIMDEISNGMSHYEGPNNNSNNFLEANDEGQDDVNETTIILKFRTDSATKNSTKKEGGIKHEDFVEFKPTPNLTTSPLKIFSHSFLIPMFSANEIEVRVHGSTIYVQCEREAPAIGAVGGSLIYSMGLPEAVNTSTLQSTWIVDELKITAWMKN